MSDENFTDIYFRGEFVAVHQIYSVISACSLFKTTCVYVHSISAYFDKKVDPALRCCVRSPSAFIYVINPHLPSEKLFTSLETLFFLLLLLAGRDFW
jgi:hypothetical protein